MTGPETNHGGRSSPGDALRAVERRRLELFGVTFFLLAAFAATTVVLSFGGFSDVTFETFGATVNLVRAALVVLCLVFAAYVLEKEIQLRRTTRALLDQQVVASSLHHRLEQVLALTDASRRVATTLDLEDLLDMVLAGASDVLGADEGSVMLVDGDELVVAAVHGREKALVGERVPLGRGIAGHVVRTGQPLLLGRELPQSLPAANRPRTEIASAISAPLRVDEETIGVININVTLGTRRFHENDLDAVAYFADHAAVGIHNARRLRRERVRSEMMGATAEDLESSLSVVADGLRTLGRDAHQWAEGEQQERLEALGRRADTLVQTTDRLLRSARARGGAPRGAPSPPANH